MSALIIMTSSFCQPPLDQKPTITICPSIPFNFLSNNWYQHNTVTQTRFVSKLFFLALLSSSSSWHSSILRLEKKDLARKKRISLFVLLQRQTVCRSHLTITDHHIADQAIIGHHTSYSINLYILVPHPSLLRSSSAG